MVRPINPDNDASQQYIAVQLEHIAHEPGMVHMVVQQNLGGVAAENLPQIFMHKKMLVYVLAKVVLFLFIFQGGCT